MSISRRTALERLAATTDAACGETTTVRALASALDADERVIEAHLDVLTECELARTCADGTVRVTITGEELLELGTVETVVVDPSASDTDR